MSTWSKIKDWLSRHNDRIWQVFTVIVWLVTALMFMLMVLLVFGE
jgi:predicted nucleic acid-binding Zn ribbon protein